jgi:low affinity Fe/Cu permease
MGSDLQPEKASWFDRFAGAASRFTSHATFFVACLTLVVIWIPSFVLFKDINTWQLIINTATTIITFLLVALLQNGQRRGEEAIQTKLDAIADGLADLMEEVGTSEAFGRDIQDLRRAVGIEVDHHG